jgi:hypothetical protein
LRGFAHDQILAAEPPPTTESSDAEDFQAEIIRRSDAPMYRAMPKVYGDQIHPGFLEGDDDDLREAALCATARLAEVRKLLRRRAGGFLGNVR